MDKSKCQITVIHNNTCPEMHWTSSSSLHVADIYESNSIQRCDFTLRWLEGCCSKWDFPRCLMPEVSFILCTAHSSWPLVSQRRPSACTKAALILCFHNWSSIVFLLLWVSALKKKKSTKSNVWPLSFSTLSYKQEKWAEFTEIIHISTYYVYKRLFLSPSENVCSPTNHASVYLN